MNCYFSPLTPDFPQVGEGRLGIIESLIANAPFFFLFNCLRNPPVL